MKKLNITKGDWGIFPAADGNTYITTDSMDVCCCTVPNIDAHATLIADAGTTYNQCGLLPSELLEQRNELLSALGYFIQKANEHQTSDSKIICGYTLAANIEGMTEILNNATAVYSKVISSERSENEN